MLDRIENTRRLAEECEVRVRRLEATGDRDAADKMAGFAQRLRWSLENLQAEAALTAFAARVEG